MCPVRNATYVSGRSHPIPDDVLCRIQPPSAEDVAFLRGLPPERLAQGSRPFARHWTDRAPAGAIFAAVGLRQSIRTGDLFRHRNALKAPGSRLTALTL